jgi:hypothetical protein
VCGNVVPLDSGGWDTIRLDAGDVSPGDGLEWCAIRVLFCCLIHTWKSGGYSDLVRATIESLPIRHGDVGSRLCPDDC